MQDQIKLLTDTIKKLKNDKIKMKKIIKELEKKTKESCRSSDADLIISQQETKECIEELEDEANKNLRCESDKKNFENKLEDHAQKNKNLKARHSETMKSLEESRSLSSANEKLAQECQNNLETEVEEKGVLQEKLKLVCQKSLWGEWSHCSGTCQGIRTRIDRCSNNEQIEACDEDISCSESGKY